MEYIGIDISKRSFDVATSSKMYKFENILKGFKSFLSLCKKLGEIHCICESTGGYEFELALFLAKNEIKISVVNPKVIKNFFRCIGANAKTDTLDAKGLRLFCEKMNDRLKVWKAPGASSIRLRKCYRRRDDLLDMITQERNRLSVENDKFLVRQINKNIDFMREQIDRLEIEMKKISEGDEEIRKIYEMVTNIEGCGKVAALGIIALMPEIGTFTRGEIAAIVGVAPFNNDSGTKQGPRAIRGGRKHLRRKLYLPTMWAMKRNPHIKAFADRLFASGKPFKKVVIASMRKLLIHINAEAKKLAWQ